MIFGTWKCSFLRIDNVIEIGLHFIYFYVIEHPTLVLNEPSFRVEGAFSGTVKRLFQSFNFLLSIPRGELE